MGKSKDIFILEASAIDLMTHMERFGSEVLAAGSGRTLPEEEREQLALALQRLRPTFNDLQTRIFDPLFEIDRTLRSRGLGLIYELMRASFLIGAHGAITEGAEVYFKPKIERDAELARAANARKKRSESPQELALRKAIVAARGNGPVEKPSKEADSIWNEVNSQLKRDGFKIVKIDVIRRRLEKMRS
jgi:hypothetical protein